LGTKTQGKEKQMSEEQKALLVEWLGKTKTSARRVMSAHLKTVTEGVRLEDDLRLQSLSQFHPNRKFPPNTVFVLRRCEPYFTRALYVVAKSGGFVDFSWIKCVANLYGKYDRDRVRRDNTHSALRNEAFNSDAMQEARGNLGSVCAHCKKRCPKLVVDHAGKPFAQIVDEFLASKGMALGDLTIRGSRTDGFRMTRLGKAWRQFHDENAVLEGLCAKCNGSLGSRGYRRTKAKADVEPDAAD
jgi:hypothetical protein